MLARTLLLPLLWSVLLLLALVVYPLVVGLGTAEPVAGLAVQTFVPPAGQPADPRSSARATSLGYAAAVGGPGAAARAPEGFERAVEDEVFRLTNVRRQQVRAAPLAADADLALAGRAHSRDMLERGFFDHVTPEGLTPSARVAGIHRTLIGGVGENLYKHVYPTGAAAADARAVAKKAVDSLINSPGHRDNIDRPEFTHLGVGVVRQGGTVLVTQVFADAAGFLATPLPGSVRPQASLDLGVTRAAPGEMPQQFAFFRADRGARAYGPFDLSRPEVSADPGHYRLEMVFATPNGRSVYFGPDIDVVR